MKPNYSKWNVTHDLSIEEYISSMESSTIPGFRVGLEIISPILLSRNGWAAEIVSVINILKDLNLRVNSTTGMHVHVGLEEAIFSLQEVKSISKCVIRIEGEYPDFG